MSANTTSRLRWALYAPRGRFLALLAQGWGLPFVVEPMIGHHGRYSILLTRDTEPRSTRMPDAEHPEMFKTRMVEIVFNALHVGRPIHEAVADVIYESQKRAMDEARTALQKIAT